MIRVCQYVPGRDNLSMKNEVSWIVSVNVLKFSKININKSINNVGINYLVPMYVMGSIQMTSVLYT